MLTFSFSRADGILSVPETLTSGMVGKEVSFEFSEEWDELGKVAVFTAGDVTRDVTLEGSKAVIPWEVLEKPMKVLFAGVYGVGDGGEVIIPTIRAKGPIILPGVDPSGDPGLGASPEIWEQAIGDIAQLRGELTRSVQSLETEFAEATVELESELVQAKAALENQIAQNYDSMQADIHEAKSELLRIIQKEIHRLLWL